MGRHRRATPAAPAAPVHQDLAGGSRHRGSHRRRSGTPVRTGMLGASAAMAMGAVAVASGLIPGPNGNYTVGDSPGPSERVRANGPSDLATLPQGSPSDSTTASDRPTDDPSAERDDGDRSKSPSATPSKTSEEKKSSAPAPSRSESRSSDDDGTSGSNVDTAPTPTRDSAEPGNDGGSASPDAETAAEAAVLRLVNQERSKAGCSPLTADPKLAKLAGDYSQDMAEGGFFAHTSPDGETPWDRAEAAGISDMGGENIARGQANAQSVMDAWMKSPGHRANILNCDFTRLGVGAHFASGGPWWTQNFGF